MYKLLYVDDEEINLRLFKANFRRDYEIFTALSGNEALEILKTETIDVLITDQKMPEMTGVELLKKVQEDYPQIPPQRLMLSGFSENEEINKAFEEYNLYRFISKPWNFKNLNDIIISALNQEKKG